MKKLISLLSLWLCASVVCWGQDPCIPCSATGSNKCYYVDSDLGNNANTDPSTPGTAVKNLFGLQLRVSTFNGGDNICLKRGSTFQSYLRLIGPGKVGSHAQNVTGTSSSAHLTVDAYGNGAPPVIQGEVAVTSWTSDGGNKYHATVNYDVSGAHPFDISAVKFGSLGGAPGVWGQCVGNNGFNQYCIGNSGVSNMASDGQFYYEGTSTGILHVYSSTGSPTNITAVWDGQIQLFEIDGVSYVDVQHLQLQNPSWYGLEIHGTLDHISAGNILADTEVPFNYHGTGFYVHPEGGSDFQFINVESDRGFYGFDFACGADTAHCLTAATLSNCKGYFNRSYGLFDETPSHSVVNYDHCHFYGNQIKWPLVGDVSGGVAGAGNIGNFVDPHIKGWKLYVPRATLSYQTIGAQFGADQALNAQLSALGAAPLSISVATNFTATAGLVTELQGWVNTGYDVSSAGLSNVSYQNDATLNVLYTGPCQFSSLTIAGHFLTVSSSGGTCPAGDSFSWDLTSSPFDTVQEVEFALRNQHFQATLPQPCGSCSWISAAAMLSKDLADVTSQNVKFTKTLFFDVGRFLPDELSGSKAWIAGHLTGTSGKYVYLYPGQLFNGTTQVYSINASYDGAIGAISMQAGADGQIGAYDAVGVTGVDAHGLVYCSMAGWGGLDATTLAQTIQVLAAKSAVWGVPYACVFRPGLLSNDQLSKIVADFSASGVTLMTNSALVALLEGGVKIPNTLPSTFYARAPDGAAVSFDPTPTYLSPTIGQGKTEDAAYQYDLWGRQQTQFRSHWDIGSQVLVPVFLGGLKPNQ